MSKIKSTLRDVADILDQGWISRLLLAGQFYLAYFMVDWAMAFGSTALAVKADLMGAAAVIGAVAAVPQALLMLATNKYMELRNTDRKGVRDANTDRSILRGRED